jgi:site-specific recombinase XerD
LRESFQQIVTLRVIQMISGHSSLETLQRYLEVTDEQIVEAVKAIGSKTSRQVEERA